MRTQVPLRLRCTGRTRSRPGAGTSSEPRPPQPAARRPPGPVRRPVRRLPPDVAEVGASVTSSPRSRVGVVRSPAASESSSSSSSRARSQSGPDAVSPVLAPGGHHERHRVLAQAAHRARAPGVQPGRPGLVDERDAGAVVVAAAAGDAAGHQGHRRPGLLDQQVLDRAGDGVVAPALVGRPPEGADQLRVVEVAPDRHHRDPMRPHPQDRAVTTRRALTRRSHSTDNGPRTGEVWVNSAANAVTLSQKVGCCSHDPPTSRRRPDRRPPYLDRHRRCRRRRPERRQRHRWPGLRGEPLLPARRRLGRPATPQRRALDPRHPDRGGPARLRGRSVGDGARGRWPPTHASDASWRAARSAPARAATTR